MSEQEQNNNTIQIYLNVSGTVIGRDLLLEYQEATFIHFGLASVSSGVDTTEAEWTFPQSKRETKHSRLPIFCNIFTIFVKQYF